MITVACVYWKGEFRGREDVYDTTWITKLQNMVARNLSIEYQFVCLSNVDVPCTRIPLIDNLPGYWSKIELFRPDIFHTEYVLYLDLDIVIVNDLQPLIEYGKTNTFTLMPNIGGNHWREGKRLISTYNSSTMFFRPGNMDDLYTEFDSGYIKEFWGDQDYIALKKPNAATFPENWVCKLKNLPGKKPNSETKVVLCMDNTPRKNIDAAKRHEWVKEVWQ